MCMMQDARLVSVACQSNLIDSPFSNCMRSGILTANIQNCSGKKPALKSILRRSGQESPYSSTHDSLDQKLVGALRRSSIGRSVSFSNDCCQARWLEGCDLNKKDGAPKLKTQRNATFGTVAHPKRTALRMPIRKGGSFDHSSSLVGSYDSYKPLPLSLLSAPSSVSVVGLRMPVRRNSNSSSFAKDHNATNTKNTDVEDGTELSLQIRL